MNAPSIRATATAPTATHTNVLLESEPPPAAPPRPSGTSVGGVVVGGIVVVVDVEVVVVAGRVVVVVTGRVVVVAGAVVVVVVEVVVVVAARVVVVVGRVVVVGGRVVVVGGGAVVVVVGAAVVVVVAGATTLTVNDPLPRPASKIPTEYDPGAALALTWTFTWHEVQPCCTLTTVSGDDADALMPPTSLVAVVETVRRSPDSTVTDPGLTLVIADSAGCTGTPTTTRNSAPASTSLAAMPIDLRRSANTCGLLNGIVPQECIGPSGSRHS